MAGLLADGLNLGLTRMAEACSIASLSQLAWTSDWHIREETYASALQRLVNQQQREPFAANFGSGTASSSDGQFFQAAGFGHKLDQAHGDLPERDDAHWMKRLLGAIWRRPSCSTTGLGACKCS